MLGYGLDSVKELADLGHLVVEEKSIAALALEFNEEVEVFVFSQSDLQVSTGSNIGFKNCIVFLVRAVVDFVVA